jgi:hypothetical protein
VMYLAWRQALMKMCVYAVYACVRVCVCVCVCVRVCMCVCVCVNVVFVCVIAIGFETPCFLI